MHVRNVFAEGELQEASKIKKMRIASADRPVTFYDLEVIISDGYRVKSERGAQFHSWAATVLRQHLLRGDMVHDRLLKALNRAARLCAAMAPP